MHGELHFKTDDDDLFAESLIYLADCGWRILTQTTDLHANEPAENIRTEHEEMFTRAGKSIKFLIAVPPQGTPELPAKYAPKPHTEEASDGEALAEP